MFELDAGIGSSESPIYLACAGIPALLPRADLLMEGRLVGDPSVQTLPTQNTQVDLGHIEPTAVLGRVVNLQLVGKALGLGWRKRFIQRAWAMGVELIHHQDDLLRLRVLHVHEVLNALCPLHPPPPVANVELPTPYQRLIEQEQVTGPIAHIFGIVALGLTRTRRQWCTYLAHQLFAHLVHTDQRSLRIVGPCVDIQHILHMVDKLRIGLGRNAPLSLLPRLQFVFLESGGPSRTRDYPHTQARPSSQPIYAASTEVARQEGLCKPKQ